MIGARLTDILPAQGLIDLHDRGDVLFLAQGIQHFQKNLCQYPGIIVSAVVMLLFYFKIGGDGIQLKVFEGGIHGPGHDKGIDLYRIFLPPAAAQGGAQKAHIKIGIMRDQQLAPIAEPEKLLQCLLLRGGARDHLIGNAGKPRNLGGDGFFGIHKGIKGFCNLTVYNADSADLDDPFTCGGKARCFQIKDNVAVTDTG